MDDKEFRKLRREDLIEIIYQYQRREQRLVQENEMLRSQLEDRRIRMEKTGSIAEAALALSGIFAAAQKAADLYLQSVKEYAASPAEKPQPAPQQPAEAEPKMEKVPEQKVPAEPKQTEAKPAAPGTSPKPADRQTEPKAVPKGMPRPIYPADRSQKPAPAQHSDTRPAPEGKPEAMLHAGKKPESIRAHQPEASKPAASAQDPETPGKAPEANAAGKTPAAPKAPASVPPKNSRPNVPEEDTDAFISSLKDILGM